MTSFSFFGRLSSQRNWKTIYLGSRYVGVDIFLCCTLSWKIVGILFDFGWFGLFTEKHEGIRLCVKGKIGWSNLWKLKLWDWPISRGFIATNWQKVITSHFSHYFTLFKFMSQPTDAYWAQFYSAPNHSLQTDLTTSQSLQICLHFRISQEGCISLLWMCDPA